MQRDAVAPAMSRRQLLRLIGVAGGSAAMYQAMSVLGFARASTFSGFPELGAAPAGASVLVLGAGIAGMVAAYELSKAGYRVQVLEYGARAGGRVMTLRGGDRYTELGGATQECRFDPGLYINPGPWRLPHHHHGILAYCRRFGVALEPFVQVNYNAYLHSANAFDGRPQRLRAIRADFHGHVAELLAKAMDDGRLDGRVDAGDVEALRGTLGWWGALDAHGRYAKGDESADRRGYARPPGGGLSGRPEASEPLALSALLASGLPGFLPLGDLYEMQNTLMQPVGGMDRIADAFARELEGTIRHGARVVEIRQDTAGVRVTWEDTATPGSRHVAAADWCVCTLPLSILGRLPVDVGQPMADAIAAVPYAASVKIGVQFRRRVGEEAEHNFGGISWPDLSIGQIGYPSSGFNAGGKGVLLGGYLWGKDAARFTAMTPDERVRAALEQGRQIHPQYDAEFEHGVSVAWHRHPGVMGCFGLWSPEARARHYDALCAIDGRIVLAGEHASYLPAWQEGAVTSALDAVGRLHRRALSGVSA